MWISSISGEKRKIYNYTPHKIVVFQGDKVVAEFPSMGNARVKTKETIVDVLKQDGKEIPVVLTIYGKVEGLPDKPEEDADYIVSSIVANALRNHPFWNTHILVPNTGPSEMGAVRDENGRIIGVRSLITPYP